MDGGQFDNSQSAWGSASGAPPTPPPQTPQYQLPPPLPPSDRRRGTNWLVVCAIILGGLILLGGFLLVIGAMVALAGGGEMPFEGIGERVGVITVNGMITAAGEDTLFGGPIGGVRPTMEQLRRAAEDDGIKAVVLRINSPGGSAAAAQELYQEVKRLAEQKPVVVSMADVAASGGYYIAAAADRIVANGSTVTGSIGVRMEYLQFYELMEKFGVEGGNLTTGPYKDTGSPFRPMRPDERKLLEDLLDDMYDQFVKAVAEGRGMDEAEVRKFADGRIFTGEQALKLGLVDELGNFYRAVEIAGELGGIKGKPRIQNLGGGKGLWELMGAMSRLAHRTVFDYLLYDERLEGVESMMRIPGPPR